MRILFYSVAGLLLLLFICYALLHSSYVQTRLVRYFTDRIERTTGVKIQIGGVDFRPMKSLILNDILLKDYRNDTLLYCEDFRVKVDSFRFTAKSFKIKEVTLDRAYFNLWIVREGKAKMNLDYFLEALEGKNNTEVKEIDKAVSSKGWMVGLEKIQIRDSRFVYKENDYEAVDYGINWTDVECRHLNVDIIKPDFTEDRTGFEVSDLSLEEKSGFVIGRMGGHVSMTDSVLWITDCKIRTERSILDLEQLRFDWVPGQGYWRNFTSKMQQYYRLGYSRVSFIDLAYFNGVLRGIENTVTCKGIVSNTVNRIEGQELEFGLGENSRFKGSFKSRGLPDVWNTVFNIKVQEAYLNPKDLETIYLPWFGQHINIPAPLHHWKHLEGELAFTGTIGDFMVSVHSQTPGLRGNVKFVYAPCTKDSLDCSRVSGNFIFPVINFGKLAGTSMIGHGSVSGDYNGYWQDDDMAVNMTGKIHSLQIGKGKIREADLFLTTDGERFDVLSSLDNDSVRLTVALNYDEGGGVPFLGAKGRVEVADLTDFGWSLVEGKEAVKTDFDLVYAEKNEKNNFSNLTLSDFSYAGPNGEFDLLNVSLENRLNAGYYTTSLLSDVLDMQIDGHYFSVRPLDFTNRLIRSYLPAYSKDKKKKKIKSKEEEIDFRYDIVLKDINRVLRVLYPEVSIAAGARIYTDYGKDKEIRLKLEADSIIYGDLRLIKSRIELKGDTERLGMIYAADEIGYNNAYRLYNIRNELELCDNKIGNKLVWSNWGNLTYSGELSANMQFIPEEKNNYSMEVNINPGVIVLADRVWNVGKSKINIADKDITIENFLIRCGKQFMAADGSISVNPEKQLSLRVNRFNLEELNRIVFENRLNVFGVATGEIVIQDYYRDNLLYSDINVENWGVNRDTLGTLRVLSAWDADSSRVLIKARNEVGKEIPLQVKGYYQPASDSLDIAVSLSKISLGRLGIYASDYFAKSTGNLSGKINISGKTRQPDFTGYVLMDSVTLKVRDVNTSFFIDDSIYIENSNFILKDFVIKDAVGNKSVCSGYYRFWANRYNLNIASVNFLLFDTGFDQNESFYGKVFMSGLTNINNDNDLVNVTVNARTENNSRLFLPLTSALTEEDGNFLHFVTSGQTLRKRGQVQSSQKGITLNANLELNDNLEVQIVFDPTIGDILKARGNGDIKVTLDQDGLVNMFGEYKISKGDYLFTLSNLLNKKFILTPGGSISWNGSPYDATININAVYNLKTSLYELLPVTNSTVDRSTKVPVECILNLNDNFTNPLVKFDINFPTLDTQTKSFVQSLFSSQDEINKQMFSLLILNKFYKPDYNSTDDIAERNAGYQAGVTTATELVSNQLSRWLSQISNNFDIGFSYRQGDNITTNEIELALSTQLLNDRITLSANGNMDVGGTKNVTSNSTNSSNIAGDFDVDVKLNRQGTLKLKAYSHTDEKIIYNATETIQGVGISYQETFDTFRELLHKYFGFLRKKSKEK